MPSKKKVANLQKRIKELESELSNAKSSNRELAKELLSRTAHPSKEIEEIGQSLAGFMTRKDPLRIVAKVGAGSEGRRTVELAQEEVDGLMTGIIQGLAASHALFGSELLQKRGWTEAYAKHLIIGAAEQYLRSDVLDEDEASKHVSIAILESLEIQPC